MLIAGLPAVVISALTADSMVVVGGANVADITAVVKQTRGRSIVR